MAGRKTDERKGIETEVFERQARICKAFANATRLQLLDLLGKRDWPAAHLQQHLGISKANLSQHVAILKAAGIIGARREGKQLYLSLAMPEAKKACHLIHDVLRAQVRNGRRLIV
jgi:DNA-binding transcriptional ArsR family regulator